MTNEPQSIELSKIESKVAKSDLNQQIISLENDKETFKFDSCNNVTSHKEH